MRHIVMKCLGGIALVLSLSASVYAQEPQIRLSLDDALSIGLKQGASIRTSELAVEQKQHAGRTTVSKLFPNIDASATYTNMLKKQKMYFDMGSSSPMGSVFPSDGIEMGQTHNIQAGISASMPLIAPQLWSSLAVSKADVALALEKVHSSKVDATAEIRKAYMGALLAEESKRVLSQSVSSTAANLENVRQKYKQGLVAEFEVVRMDVQLSNVVTELTRATEGSRLAKMKLLVLIGMEAKPDQVVLLADQLESYSSQLSQTPNLSNGQDYTINSGTNTTLRTLDLTGQQLQQVIKTSKMAYLPTLALNFAYNYSYANNKLELSNSRRWSPFSTVTLALSVPIFSGGNRYYTIKGYQSQLQQLAIQRLDTERQLNLALRSALSDKDTALIQYWSTNTAVQSAQKAYDIATVRYQTGQGTLLELNDAEVTLRQAQLSRSQSIYNYMVAIYSIDQLEGRVYEAETK